MNPKTLCVGGFALEEKRLHRHTLLLSKGCLAACNGPAELALGLIYLCSLIELGTARVLLEINVGGYAQGGMRIDKGIARMFEVSAATVQRVRKCC